MGGDGKGVRIGVGCSTCCEGCYDSCCPGGSGGFGIGGYGGFGSYPGCGYKECGGCACFNRFSRFDRYGEFRPGVYRNPSAYTAWGRNGTYLGPHNRYGRYWG